MKNARDHKKPMKPILAGAIYPRPVFMEYTGIGEAAFRTMLRNGLPTTRIAGRTFVSGEKFLQFCGGLESTESA